MMRIVEEFKDFLRKYKVMGVAVAFIMATATTDLVKSIVNDMLMPIINVILPEGGWEAATITLGPVVFAVGAFIAALINFLILAFVVFVIAKVVIREEKVEKK